MIHAVLSGSPYEGDNLLFLDQRGDAAVVEMQPGAQKIREPEDNTLWCSNCFVEFEQAAGNEQGRGRYETLTEVLRTESPSLSRSFMHKLLSSHEGDFPLCRDSTQLSFVANPATGRLEVADGYPCQVGFVQMR